MRNIKIDQSNIIEFKRDFYTNIQESIILSFGEENYALHLKEIKKYILQESETQLVSDNIQLAKIGFKENEFLTYERTFAEWKNTANFLSKDDKTTQEILEQEEELQEAESLIDEYFILDPQNHLEKILFIVADFGKGKSVFLRQYAASLSRRYIYSGTGDFPIYFNLRDYKSYSGDHHLGVIGNFLETKYGIRINEEPYRNRRYIFLIDSLDECGSLDSINIDNVIASIKKIQNIDRTEIKLNKIIMATRPFEGGLQKHLEIHRPFCIENSQGRKINQYVSLYGFKKEQFNHWLYESIRAMPGLQEMENNGLNGEILSTIKKGNNIDIYDIFLKNSIISYDELRRPIFAYIIYQLLSNSINFDQTGKIGIYLSFLNLLTKEAKYIHDINYNVDLKEQFEARSILHSIASLWLYNFSTSGKTEIKRADIYRSFKGDIIDESDEKVVINFRNNGHKELEFLSHSYFGDQNSVLHFQHQSFAEILMAEYYFKVLLKYALDQDMDFEEARVKLSVGTPTPQTINFLIDLLELVRSSISGDHCEEKRKLLFPLLASLSLSKYSKGVSSQKLYFTWFEKIKFEENSSIIHDEYIKNWPISQEIVSSICQLCRLILNSDVTLSLQSGTFKTALFNGEVFIDKQKKTIQNIDKWIAFISANILFNDKERNLWFNRTIINQINILDQLNTVNRVPSWSRRFFTGFDLSNNNTTLDLIGLQLYGFNFSYSKLHNIDFRRCFFGGSDFSNCMLTNCDFGFANITRCNFSNTQINSYSNFALTVLEQGVLFPYSLAYMDWDQLKKESITRPEAERIGILTNCGDNKSTVTEILDGELAKLIGNLLKSGFKEKKWDWMEIRNAFKVDLLDAEENFYKVIENILHA